MSLYVFDRVALVFVWYELHLASPPVSCSISSICPGSSRTYTLKPSNSNCLLRCTCKGRNVMPGALTSTNASLPPGIRTILSGTPSVPGDTNFGHRPPCFFTAAASRRSMSRSRYELIHDPFHALMHSLVHFIPRLCGRGAVEHIRVL